VTANETSDSVSLVSVRDQKVLDEIAVGQRPAYIALCPDGLTVLVSCEYSGEVVVLKVASNRLKVVGRIPVGFEPCGIAVAATGNKAFVGLVASGEVAEVDWNALTILRKFKAGLWPRYLAISPDGQRLAVGCAGEAKIITLDTATGNTNFENSLTGGINFGHMQSSADGKLAYFPWMVYRSNPITAGNIRLGWVLASRIGRIRLDEQTYREAISLDVPREAVADPHGLALSRDEERLVVSAPGTHELLVYHLPELPFIGTGGPGDLIDRKLMGNVDVFYRLELGGRPMGIELADDSRTLFVANYLKNSVQVVDIEEGTIEAEIALGGPETPSLVRKGQAIFYDGRRSLDQWYSCHSCHQQGGTNSKPMDTQNDGSDMTFKTVLPLYNLSHTKPWTWHGWQEDLNAAMKKSMTSTMLGPNPKDEDVTALIAYLDSLKLPPNPFREKDGSLSASAQRGKVIFESDKAGCANCHTGDYFTDGKVHDVGLGSEDDKYEGFNTPSLLGVYRRVRLLHHGRATSLEDLVTNLHAPSKVAGTEDLREEELEDLVAYLKSL
jgi:mono/diheme cytochrome c family protein